MSLPIGLHFLSLLTTATMRCDSDLKAVMSTLDLSVHTEEGRPPLLPLTVLVALHEQLEARARRGRFIFALADVFNLDEHPAVAAFVASAGSLRQLLRLLSWLPRVMHPNFGFEIEETASDIRLYPQVLTDDPRLQEHPLLIEFMTAAMLRMVQLVAPGFPLVAEIHFRHAPLVDPDSYTRYFGCPVRFRAERNGLRGDRLVLDMPLPGSLPQANASAEETILVHVLGDGLAPSLTDQMTRLLRGRLSLFAEGLPGIARALQRHPRALQRELRAAGTSYSAVVSSLRHELAREMLNDPALDIDSIALKLGYGERRSFTLAFRGWQGTTPSAWRRRNGDAD